MMTLNQENSHKSTTKHILQNTKSTTLEIQMTQESVPEQL